MQKGEEAFLLTWSILMTQSVSRLPSRERASMKLVFGTWLFTSLILTIVYRSNLKAMIIIPKETRPFDTLEELIQFPISLGILKYTTLHDIIDSAEANSTLGRLKEKLLLFPAAQQARHVQDVFRGKFVGMGSMKTITGIINGHYSKTGSCGLYMMSRGFLGPNSLCFAFPKGSHLKPPVDKVIQGLSAGGIIQHLMNGVLTNASHCTKATVYTASSLTTRTLKIYNFYGIFSLFCAVLALPVREGSTSRGTLQRCYASDPRYHHATSRILEADMAGMGLLLSQTRNQVLSLSEPLMIDETNTAYPPPLPSSDITGFVKTYTPLVGVVASGNGSSVGAVGNLSAA
ncbi:hypothetical protein Pmani_000111 [Petrolisthes manimaculis]|uniref:Ionotropic glutamate receptor C-terminal domain-containing protein n=1 Tax=Petrolisthes manimaculis TaxID=1843537 RepID=A0AAE1QPT9_9EUCA|nr:hypothetical protein Pmani_000111 [Petrolisthes manimaculis]